MIPLAFFLSGLSAIIYQLIWQRVLAGIYGANIESVTVVVTGFMIGLGAGSLAGGWLADRRGVNGLRTFAALELGVGLAGLVSIPVFHWVGGLTSGVGIGGLWAVVLALLVVPAALMGATLPVLTAFAVRQSRSVGASVGWLYGVNTLGSAAGALVAVIVLVGRLGQQGSVVFAASLNLIAAAVAFASGRFGAADPARGAGLTPRASSAEEPGGTPGPVFGRPAFWVTLAFASGFIALSYELVWYRAYSIALMARAQAFGVLLGGYLAGIGIGAGIAGRIAARVRDRRTLVRVLGWVLLFGSLVAYLLVPIFARFVTVSRQWAIAPALVAIAACALGIVFPLVVQASAPALDRAGRRTSHLYAANIAGSALGSLITGFWLMDHAGVAAITTGLAIAMATLGGMVLAWRTAAPETRQVASLVSVAVVILLIVVGRTVLFEDVYDRLMFRVGYGPAMRFADVAENRSGVIGVMADGAVYGSGVYDGHYNTDLHQARVNLIHRAYALGLFHPKPRRVLMIGLSSGSWASVVTNHPDVESVTVVEINPGYVGLLGHHPVVSNLTTDPRVHIVIDDGRRWLLRHDDERFDVIVANTTYHWRANASSLLSVEFLGLVRRHLAPGGVYYFNTTQEPRVQKTAATVFPAAWRVYGMMAVGDAPIAPDFERFGDQLGAYRVYGQPCLNLTSAADRALRDLILDDMAADLEPRDKILARTKDLALVTDDNMGTEWRR
jgi:predicted membrane-bound spermidine synthase